ncbi:MAG: helix-turn-helix domain-containing protein, partial [bacterium]|nr:helix-turn-helix domain-containing protein [bacterium]
MGFVQYISLAEASKLSPYSQEYLSLLARRGKIFAKKIGRNWYTTREALADYISKQDIIENVSATLVSASSDDEKNIHAKHSQIFEEFEKVNVEKSAPVFSPPVVPVQNIPVQQLPVVVPDQHAAELIEIKKREEEIAGTQNVVFEKLDKLSGSLEKFARQITEKVSKPVEHPHPVNSLYSSGSSGRGMFRMTTVMVTVVVILFLLVGGFGFGQTDYVARQIKKAFKDADTLQGYFPGTHANEVLVLDKNGNVSIFGHIETQGQLRSHAPEGVAPIVIDSVTKVENLNADYFDDLDSKDFTLAFVTKNGNVTHEDVFLEGNVEVGKTLTVKGAAKLLDSLTVYGKLGVFAEAVFGKDVKLTAGNLQLDKGHAVLQEGNLKLATGTIEINNRSLIKNLNAEFLQGTQPSDYTLDFVVGNGDSTDRVAFFNGGLYGGDGAFSSLGVAGDVSIGSENDDDNTVSIFSKKFDLDRLGNITTSGNVGIGGTLSTGPIISNLIPSGSFDLGSSTNRWNKIFGATGDFTNLSASSLTVSGSANFTGTSSSSFRINSDNTASDSEDSYLAFDRGNFANGSLRQHAMITWNSTAKRFDINQPIHISSSSFTAWGDITLGSISSNALTLNTSTVSIPNNLNFDSNTFFLDSTNNRVGILTIAPSTVFEVQGTASASYLLTGNTLQVGGFSSAAYSRFGTATATQTAFITTTNDLLISGDLEVDGKVFFDDTASVASNFEVGGYASISNTLYVSTLGKTGNVGIGTASPNATLSVIGSGSYSGLLTLTNQGAVHTGSWPDFIGTNGTTLLINPSSAVADGNLLTISVASSPKVVIDAEGDIFAKSLTLTGTTTQATTVTTGNLTVEGNTTLGDAQTDVIKLTGIIRPFSLTTFPLLVRASTSQTEDVFRFQDTNANILLTLDQGSGLLTASSGFNFALGGSTATVSYSRLGTNTTTYSSDLSKFNDLLISGNLEVDLKSYFDAPGEFQGTASASYLLTGNTLQVGGFSSAAYSRFGTATATQTAFITTTNDL